MTKLKTKAAIDAVLGMQKVYNKWQDARHEYQHQIIELAKVIYDQGVKGLNAKKQVLLEASQELDQNLISNQINLQNFVDQSQTIHDCFVALTDLQEALDDLQVKLDQEPERLVHRVDVDYLINLSKLLSQDDEKFKLTPELKQVKQVFDELFDVLKKTDTVANQTLLDCNFFVDQKSLRSYVEKDGF